MSGVHHIRISITRGKKFTTSLGVDVHHEFLLETFQTSVLSRVRIFTKDLLHAGARLLLESVPNTFPQLLLHLVKSKEKQ